MAEARKRKNDTPVDGVQIGEGGPILPLPKGWSVLADQDRPGALWAAHPDLDQFFLGCAACAEDVRLEDRVDYHLNAMTDARVVSIETADDVEWRVTYHCVNGALSSVYLEEFVRSTVPLLLCASIASRAYPQQRSLISDYFREARRSLVLHGLGKDPKAH